MAEVVQFVSHSTHPLYCCHVGWVLWFVLRLVLRCDLIRGTVGGGVWEKGLVGAGENQESFGRGRMQSHRHPDPGLPRVPGSVSRVSCCAAPDSTVTLRVTIGVSRGLLLPCHAEVFLRERHTFPSTRHQSLSLPFFWGTFSLPRY